MNDFDNNFGAKVDQWIDEWLNPFEELPARVDLIPIDEIENEVINALRSLASDGEYVSSDELRIPCRSGIRDAFADAWQAGHEAAKTDRNFDDINHALRTALGNMNGPYPEGIQHAATILQTLIEELQDHNHSEDDHEPGARTVRMIYQKRMFRF